MMKSMEDLFHNLLQDVYYAKKQLVKTLPKLAKKSTSPELEKAFMDHRSETEQHVERLERMLKMIGKKARARKCDAILGIIKEGEDVMKQAGALTAATPQRARTRPAAGSTGTDASTNVIINGRPWRMRRRCSPAGDRG